MEPTDLDKLIKAKIKGEHHAHQREMQDAKPFVWSAIQREIASSGALKWYHLAAAVILLLIGFGFIFQNLKNYHKQELAALSAQMDGLKQNYERQVSAIDRKDEQVSVLLDELNELKYELIENQNDKQAVITRERIVYRTDTVYLKQVEYVTKSESPTVISEVDEKLRETEQEAQQKNGSIVQHAIYPGYSNKQTTQKTEKVRVTFGKFRAVSN